MSNITEFPFEARSYLTVQRAGGWFNVVLVTPRPGDDLHAIKARFSNRQQAIEAGKRAGARRLIPFKTWGASA
ncbi:hypothetical protein ABIE58_000034 [Roseovarius sp. MBR-78]|jgi:hypothetical protein|uniref:hypothetical protein n=1 Tax=Roseovarius sp. MBR-78 TaxID=3156460 RepID=UPI00339312FE